MSGLAVIKIATETIGPFWSLTTSQIYAELGHLTDHGYIEHAATGVYGTRIFSLTTKGRKVFAERINTMPGSESIRFPLLLFMQFGEHMQPDARTQMLAAHRMQHTETLERYRAVVKEGTESPFDEAVLSFGERYEAMVLEWFDEVEARFSTK